MNPDIILKKYYNSNSELYNILFHHSCSVTEKALKIAEKNPHENFDLKFVQEAAMLHDLGIFLTNAPRIKCFGENPYICHGYLGSQIMQKEGYPKHAKVCERHTGTGISLDQIKQKNLPLPHRNFLPITKEEQLICFADKFFSKTKLGQELPISTIQESLQKYGENSVNIFNNWCQKWL